MSQMSQTVLGGACALAEALLVQSGAHEPFHTSLSILGWGLLQSAPLLCCWLELQL